MVFLYQMSRIINMGKTHTILVVEDNDFVRTQMVTFLKEAGFSVIEAVEGNHALEVLNKKVSLAIVDIHMEPMDGFDFIAMVREGEYNIPIVVVTGDEHPPITEKAKAHGADEVLLKPIQKDRLLAAVQSLLDRK